MVSCFYTAAKQSDTFPPTMLLLINSIEHDIIEERGLEQHHIDILVWMGELMLLQLDEENLDPLLEQVLCKLTGYWPIDPPWYKRIKDFDEHGKLKK